MPLTVRDSALLDALERLPQSPYEGQVWCSVAQGRKPTDCGRPGGRWDDITFDVLYTSKTREGAIEERRFHLYRGQPIPPSKMRYEMYALAVSLRKVIDFLDFSSLQAIGMETRTYGQVSYAEKDSEYPRSQAIGEACFFLGADGILVPNARHNSKNLVIFCEQDTALSIAVAKAYGVITGLIPP